MGMVDWYTRKRINNPTPRKFKDFQRGSNEITWDKLNHLESFLIEKLNKQTLDLPAPAPTHCISILMIFIIPHDNQFWYSRTSSSRLPSNSIGQFSSSSSELHNKNIYIFSRVRRFWASQLIGCLRRRWGYLHWTKCLGRQVMPGSWRSVEVHR